ncbi:MAG: hypothetical protein C4K49_12030 [Candidatus Thorarchaeota archaeon]|nr:MAG: hypothetical protein C4K49_12030 [Candidatus Thorarchaeota archaeon]
MKIRDAAIGANASMYYRLDLHRIKGVYYPKTEREVLAAIEHARAHGFSVTPKGGGSGLSGACTGGNGERVMVSSLQMKKILRVSKDRGYIDIQPGITPDEINEFLQPMGMRFHMTPSSRDIATVGGLLSTDGGGNDAWFNGTMRDNTIRVKMVLYDGSRLTVDWKGVKSSNTELEERLNKKKVTIHDVACSHGTMGFITELRLAIKPEANEPLVGAIIELDDYDALGKFILRMIETKCPVKYSEAIVFAHEDIKESLKPPLLIMQFPEDFELHLFDQRIRLLEKAKLERLKDYRIKMAKRNPNTGMQISLFEDYGFHDENLADLQHTIDEIESLLMSHGFAPFAKYGHAPSKWYLGNNSPTYGLLMHSNEIKPEGKTRQETYQAVKDIVKKCDELGVTPKPEHKWLYSDEVKKARLEEIRAVIGQGFNPFIFEPDCASDTLSSML